MPQRFEIRQTISTNAQRRTAQIVVVFNNRCVTRHIKNGIGRHPDDSLPAYHRKLEERVVENKRRQQDALEAKAHFEKTKPKDWEAFVVSLEQQRQRLVDELQVMIGALEIVKKEDPLMVSYF